MDRQKVKSSNVKSVGYDPGSKTMEIEFLNGGVFQYRGVEAAAHQDLLKAPSIGGHLARNVRGKFETIKIPREVKP